MAFGPLPAGVAALITDGVTTETTDRNDACRSVGIECDEHGYTPVRLFVEVADPDERESVGDARYVVCVYLPDGVVEDVCATDDETAAVFAYMDARDRWLRWVEVAR